MIQDSRFKKRMFLRRSGLLGWLFPESCFLNRESPRSGFTLIEMMVTFAIFAVIMVIAVGSLVSLMGANHKAQALKTVVNNMHFALENISRNIRTGAVYHCDIATGTLTVARDCAQDPASSIIFTARDGNRIVYKYTAGADGSGTIDRAIFSVGEEWRLSDPGTFVPITAPEVKVEQFRFYVDGTSLDDKEQPRVLIVVKGFMQGKSKVPSRFDIQTLVSQRLLDIE